MAARKKKEGSRLPILGILAAVLVGYVLFIRSPKVSKEPPIKENISQLTSVDKYLGNGVASRSYSNGKFRLNLTAFLPKAPLGDVYQARLASETLEPKTIFLGELTAAGDVYTLNYEGNTDYSGYNVVEVISLTSTTKAEKILLRGNF